MKVPDNIIAQLRTLAIESPNQDVMVRTGTGSCVGGRPVDVLEELKND